MFQGANFRDLPGVLVGPNNIVEWDPNVKRVLLKSGKPLVRVLLPNSGHVVFVAAHIFCYMTLDVTTCQTAGPMRVAFNTLLSFYYSIKVFVI